MGRYPLFQSTEEPFLPRNELTYTTLQPTSSLVDVFSRIEDILHQASFGPEKRYEIIFQLLLAKIWLTEIPG